MIALRVCRLLAVATICLPAATFGQSGYLKHDPPPDTNKPFTGANYDCWLHTAANMLAGAGYGLESSSEQDRAEEIFTDLYNHFGAASG